MPCPVTAPPPTVTYPADQHCEIEAKCEHHEADNDDHKQQVHHHGAPCWLRTWCCRPWGCFLLRAKTAGRILNPCLWSRVCNRSMWCCSAALSAGTAHAGGNNCSSSKVQVSAGYFLIALASRELDGLIPHRGRNL